MRQAGRGIVSSMALCRIAVALLLVVCPESLAEDRAGFFGLNGLSFFHYRDAPDADAIAHRKLDWLKSAGASWDRFDFWWGEIEPQPGRFKWDKADWLIDLYARSGVEMLPILCYRAQWMKDPPQREKDFAQFADYTFAVVSRYKDRVKCWEIWNEPNIPTFWKPPNSTDYAKLLKAAYVAAKRADPDCTIVAAATSETDINFILDIARHGAAKSMDAISFHPYSMADGPEEMHFARQIRNMKWATDKIGRKGIPLWITEMGWTADIARPDEVAKQCRYMVQAHAVALAGGIERMAWFNLQDWREDKRIEGWGMVSPEGKIKPTLGVYRAMVEQLDGCRFKGYLPIEGGVAAVFERFKRMPASGPEKVVIAWAKRGREATLELPVPAPVYDLSGKPLALSGQSFRLSADPVYVVFPARVQLDTTPLLAEPQNLLVNGDIEEGSPADAYGWHQGVFYGGADKGTFSIDSSVASSGQRSLRIGPADDAMWQSFPIPARPGERFTVTGKVRSRDATGENCLQLLYLSGPGWGWKGGPKSESLIGTSDWKSFTLTGVVPDDADVVRVNCISKGNTGTVWFDELSVTATEK